MKDLRVDLRDGSCEAGIWAILDEHNLAHLDVRVLASVVHRGSSIAFLRDDVERVIPERSRHCWWAPRITGPSTGCHSRMAPDGRASSDASRHLGLLHENGDLLQVVDRITISLDRLDPLPDGWMFRLGRHFEMLHKARIDNVGKEPAWIVRQGRTGFLGDGVRDGHLEGSRHDPTHWFWQR